MPSATAILDRFLHHAEIITITGKSYRLRQQTAAKSGRGPAAKADTDEGEACQTKTK